MPSALAGATDRTPAILFLGSLFLPLCPFAGPSAAAITRLKERVSGCFTLCSSPVLALLVDYRPHLYRGEIQPACWLAAPRCMGMPEVFLAFEPGAL